MEIVIGIIVLGGIVYFAYHQLNKEKPDGSHPLDSVTKDSLVKLGPEPVEQVAEPVVPPVVTTPAPAPVKAKRQPAKKQPAKVAAKTAKKKSTAKTTVA